MSGIAKRMSVALRSIGGIGINKAVSMRPHGCRLAVTGVVGTFWMGLAVAASPIVSWERIEGIVPHPDAPPAGGAIAGIQPVAFPWSVTRGYARLNTRTNALTFYVNGLSMGGSIGIGTTGAVTAVKGTIVCATTFVVSDTESVGISKSGDTYFFGQLSAAVDCDPSNLIFLLRVAEAVGGPPIQDFWLASGAVRRIR